MYPISDLSEIGSTPLHMSGYVELLVIQPPLAVARESGPPIVLSIPVPSSSLPVRPAAALQ